MEVAVKVRRLLPLLNVQIEVKPRITGLRQVERNGLVPSVSFLEDPTEGLRRVETRVDPALANPVSKHSEVSGAVLTVLHVDQKLEIGALDPRCVGNDLPLLVSKREVGSRRILRSNDQPERDRLDDERGREHRHNYLVYALRLRNTLGHLLLHLTSVGIEPEGLDRHSGEGEHNE